MYNKEQTEGILYVVPGDDVVGMLAEYYEGDAMLAATTRIHAGCITGRSIASYRGRNVDAVHCIMLVQEYSWRREACSDPDLFAILGSKYPHSAIL